MDLTTTIVVADTGRNLKEAVAAPQALVVAAESEVEVEHTLVEVEVELTVLNLKTSYKFQVWVNSVFVVCYCAHILIWNKR